MGDGMLNESLLDKKKRYLVGVSGGVDSMALLDMLVKKEGMFICCSGLATGASWLCYYHALQLGPASVVAPVDKLSVLVTVAFSYFVFGEKLNKKEALGLFLLTAGTVAMVFLH